MVEERITLVVISDRHRFISTADGKIPWRIAADLDSFRNFTMHKPVILGMKTYRGLKKILDGRHSIVLSRIAPYRNDATIISVANNMEEALTLARNSRLYQHDICVIGGQEIYEMFLPVATDILWTVVNQDIPEHNLGKRFPKLSFGEWRLVTNTPIREDPFTAQILHLKRQNQAEPQIAATSSDVVSLKAIREAKDGPEADQIAHDIYGRKEYKFLIEYEVFNWDTGKTDIFGISLFAANLTMAQYRFDCLRQSGNVIGQSYAEVDA